MTAETVFDFQFYKNEQKQREISFRKIVQFGGFGGLVTKLGLRETIAVGKL